MLRLPEEDYRIIDAFRAEKLPIYPIVPAEDLLADLWSVEKEYLYHLLGDNFDISKIITYEKPKEELKKEMDDLTTSSPFANNFKKWIRTIHNEYSYLFNLPNYVAPGITAGIIDSNDEAYQISRLLEVDNLINNNIAFFAKKTITIHKPDGHDYKFDTNSRPLRVLKTLAEAFQIEGYEEFRLAHSRIMNKKTVKGELHLSIHPLDFYTMSVNANDWTSCMRWDCDDPGEYCMGTVEMCNSPYTLVAYLSSSEKLSISEGYTWNSKKWREIFLINPKDGYIAAIKGYPIWEHNLERIVLDWLAELIQPKQKYTISVYDFSTKREKTNPFHFFTNFMYNDFCYLEHLILTWDDKFDPTINHNLNYSGKAQCMVCGSSDVLFTDTLCCNDCDEVQVCSCCGSRIYDYENNYIVENKIVCEACFENSYNCDDCGNNFWEDDIIYVALNEHDFYFCPDCFNKYFTGTVPFNELTNFFEPTRENLTIEGEETYGHFFE